MKLNEAHIKLSNAGMGVLDIQYCLILLNALPNSYKVVASTLLASGPASNLKYSKITAHILNEEGWKLGPSASLNAACTGKNKKDKSTLTCQYCNKKGHIKHDCRKKKKDEAEQEEEDSSNLDSSDSESHKAANTLVLDTAEKVNIGFNVYL